MSNITKVEPVKYDFISRDQEPWIKIAQQIVAAPHARLEDDYCRTCLIGLRSINDESCRTAVEILNKQLKK